MNNDQVTGVLSGVLTMMRSNPDVALKALGGFMPTIISVLSSGMFSESVLLSALDILTCTAKSRDGRELLGKNSVEETLRALSLSSTASSAVRAAATRLVHDLAAPVSATASAAGAASNSRRGPAPALRTVKLSLAGALVGSDRRTEDGYIRALLLVDGVTSVTLDRKAETATVFYTLSLGTLGWNEDESSADTRMQGSLMSALQHSCDESRDVAGKPRVVLRGIQHADSASTAGYLDSEEGGGNKENSGADDGWGALGGKSGVALVEVLGGADRSAAERLKAKQGTASAGGLLGWFGW